MLVLLFICIGAFLLFGLVILIDNIRSSKHKDIYKVRFSGKLNDKLLTSTELRFYTALKQITDSYHLIICIKVRLADIIRTKGDRNLSKISGKHIDFTICKIDTTPLLFVELDDTSHLLAKNKANDSKKDYIFSTLGVNIVRVKTGQEKEGLVAITNRLKSKLSIK